MTHPSSLDLEAFACGESRTPAGARVTEHLALCDACRAFVEHLGAVVAIGPSVAEAEAMVARALGTPMIDAPSAKDAGDAKSAPVVSLAERRTRRNATIGRFATSILAPLAVAAAVILFVRSGRDPRLADPRPQPVPEPTTDHILMAPMPPRTSVAPSGETEPDTTFKGGMTLAVVRERGGDQARFASSGQVRVQAGDRLRVEVALDREQAILGGVLADDGSYLELMPLAVRGPGTHFSEKSARIDASDTFGTIVVGPPEAIARIRVTRQVQPGAREAGVLTLRVEPEQGQRP